jgi:hypothetical protein
MLSMELTGGMTSYSWKGDPLVGSLNKHWPTLSSDWGGGWCTLLFESKKTPVFSNFLKNYLVDFDVVCGI